MVAAESSEREPYIRLIETRPDINGRYEHIRRLDPNAGDGYFSLVFSARDRDTNQMVCLKFYDPTKSDMYRVNCFQRESDILSSLSGQPDILPLVQPCSELRVEVATQDGPLHLPLRYLVTPLARSDVKRYIYSPRNRTLRSLVVFRAMCRAVQRIHQLDICHRDLKPANFLFLDRNSVVLGDFGTARRLDESASPMLEEYGIMPRGDKRYTAPEMFCGLDVDPQYFYGADLFSLGAILFEMFTGSILTDSIYGPSFVRDLAGVFTVVRPEERRSLYHTLIPAIAAARPLPSLRDLTDAIPGAILHRLDRLYKDLADLDCRRRCKSFSQVFAEIDICVGKLLVGRKRYEWMRKRKWTYRAAVKQAQASAVETEREE